MKRRHSALNAVQIAINGARRLSDADVQGHMALIERAEREFAQGIDCARHWASLADTANMAETFAAMGIGSGAQADDVIERAQRALSEVHQRHAIRGTWTLYADEIDAIHWLVRLHAVQLGACSYREFATAMDRTQQRLAQARAGNAPAGAIVVVGQMGAAA